ncbi:MAG: thioesterase superfamily protein [Peptococcaceae bacterium]|jgi:acyl-CoA thioesterase|nr:thioesterase superfamily protein [Peptococcaceae bacterium]
MIWWKEGLHDCLKIAELGQEGGCFTVFKGYFVEEREVIILKNRVKLKGLFSLISQQGLPEDIVQWIEEVNQNTPFHLLTEMAVSELQPDVAVVTVMVQEKHKNPRGIAHGGVIMSLADTAMGMAIRTKGYVGTTVEMNINFLEPVTVGEEIKAIGKVIKWGKNIIVCECDVRGDEKLVAKARGTFYLVDRK